MNSITLKLLGPNFVIISTEFVLSDINAIYETHNIKR